MAREGGKEMRLRAAYLKLACLSLAVLVLAFAWAPAAVVAAGPTVTVNPASGPPTAVVNVKGSGFGVTEAVDVYFDSTDMVVASTNATGAFAVSIHVPVSAQPGTHYVTAVGRTSGLSAQHVFTVRTDWPQFHRDVARTGNNPFENTLTTGNVAQLSEAWTFTTGGAVESSPAVVNGVLFVGSNDGTLYAINASTGTLKWSVTLGGAVKSSPAVVGGVVYIGGENGHVYALN